MHRESCVCVCVCGRAEKQRTNHSGRKPKKNFGSEVIRLFAGERGALMAQQPRRRQKLRLIVRQVIYEGAGAPQGGGGGRGLCRCSTLGPLSPLFLDRALAGWGWVDESERGVVR